MRHGKLLALTAALASIPAGAMAQDGRTPGAMPMMALQPPPAIHRPMPVAPGGHWHVMPRPRGWVWGRPGWWGGSHQPPIRGYILPSFWLSPGYVVSDWDGYGFAEPGRGRRWVRYYDDAVLVDGRGMIYDSVNDVPWGRYSRGPVPAYVGGASEAAPPYGADYDNGIDDEVTWQGGSIRSLRGDRQIWAWPNQTVSAQGGTIVMVPPGATTTIMIQPQQMVTTTTISYEDVAPASKARAPAKTKYRSSSPPKVIGRVPVKKAS